MPVSKRLLFLVALLGCFVFMPEKAHALGLINASASATTSRPSPSSPLNLSVDPLSIGSSGVSVFNNISTYLSSDSAKFFDSGAFSENVTIATTSADKLTASFTTSTTVAHGKASVLAVPITAMHIVSFSPQTAIPIGGKIVISYPVSNSFSGSDTNQASPSANTWMFNGLNGTTDIQMKTSLGTATCSWALSGVSNGSNNQIPTATCTTSGATIPAGATVWVFLGCTAATTDAQGGRCTAQRPLIINPTNTGTRGTASVKSVSIATQDGSNNILDQSTVKMGTIESVFVVAHVDPTFSFTIDGVAASTDMHTSQTCSTSYANISTNATFASTPTEVNLGTISSAGNTYAAQKMTLRSNTGVGYAITATSSGFLLNPANGSYIVNAQGNVTANNTPAPTTINSTTGGYGINPCDANSRVSTSVWGQASPNFANPSPNFYYTLVNYSGAPDQAGDIIYSVYGVRAGGSTPPGDYWQIITYTASVTF
jgi:hypothetical protein